LNTRWLVRMARWAHRPPSPRRVVFVLAVLAAVLALAAIEQLLGWPDWLTPAGGPRGRLPGY